LKKNKISKNWVNKQRRDTYVRQSKVDGYRARSAYKLIEIDDKFKIFKGGISVIDIGAAPGSWSQYAAKAAKSGRLISIDLKEMEPIGNTVQIQGDFTEENIQDEIKKHIKDKIDVVMSDMAVNTTGIKNIDSIQTGELCKEAMFFAKDQLKNNGYFISKIFMGGTFNEIVAEGKNILKKLRFLNQNLAEKTLKKVL
jgi:23S rRNA (uridine2552-2'-O)-methyltransferase